MATEFTCGSVPLMYREFYEVVCTTSNDLFDRNLFVRVLSSSGLSHEVLSQIWDAVDSRQNCLTRVGLYKALALVALAQQGRAVNTKLLDSYSDQELPVPNLGELSDLRTLGHVVRKERSPNALSYSYADLCDLDTVSVALIPEKKGLILKHVEYEVSSQRWRTVVLRRYSDFVALQDILLLRYPYRAIPRLPPKKVIVTEDRQFIEHRRRSLHRFLTIVARHPSIANEHILKYFLTYKGSEVHHKMRDQFRNMPDEFMTSTLAATSKDLIGENAATEFARSREHIRVLVDVLTRVHDIAERLVSAANVYANDMNQLSKELSYIATDVTSVTSWACGTSTAWPQMKKGFRSAAPEFGGLVETSSRQAIKLEEDFADTVGILLDVLLAYKDLCERHEKGVVSEHQKTIQKLNQYKKKSSAVSHSHSAPEALERLECHILEQESEISNMENRACFALHCIQMETQLVYANMEVLSNVLQKMAEHERIFHSELAGAWAQLCPLLSSAITHPVGRKTAPHGTQDSHITTNNNNNGLKQ